MNFIVLRSYLDYYFCNSLNFIYYHFIILFITHKKFLRAFLYIITYTITYLSSSFSEFFNLES